MSPHATTYAFPAVAISSITQRVIGVPPCRPRNQRRRRGLGSPASTRRARDGRVVPPRETRRRLPADAHHYARRRLRRTAYWDRKPATIGSTTRTPSQSSRPPSWAGRPCVAAGLAAMPARARLCEFGALLFSDRAGTVHGLLARNFIRAVRPRLSTADAVCCTVTCCQLCIIALP